MRNALIVIAIFSFNAQAWSVEDRLSDAQKNGLNHCLSRLKEIVFTDPAIVKSERWQNQFGYHEPVVNFVSDSHNTSPQNSSYQYSPRVENFIVEIDQVKYWAQLHGVNYELSEAGYSCEMARSFNIWNIDIYNDQGRRVYYRNLSDREFARFTARVSQ